MQIYNVKEKQKPNFFILIVFVFPLHYTFAQDYRLLHLQ